jgi:hypothetical protein
VTADDVTGTQRITGDWQVGDHDDNAQSAYLSVSTPFDDGFHLSVVPSVDWSEVANLIVDLDYVDAAHDYRQSRTLNFSETTLSALPPPQWRFLLRDPGARSYRYMTKTLRKDGSVTGTEWQTVETDAGTLVVGDAVGGVVKLSVDPADTGLGTTMRRVIVRLAYEDPANNVHDTAAFAFSGPTPQVWSVARADARANRYTYDIQYVSMTGQTVSVTGEGMFSSGNDFFFVPAPPAATIPPISPTPAPVPEPMPTPVPPGPGPQPVPPGPQPGPVPPAPRPQPAPPGPTPGPTPQPVPPGGPPVPGPTPGP